MYEELNPVFTRVTLVEDGPGHLGGMLAQFDPGPDL